MKKQDFLSEACKIVTNVPCTCTDITLLMNACHEAAAYRSEHKMPHVEKFVAMEDKLRPIAEELDKKIDEECD